MTKACVYKSARNLLRLVLISLLLPFSASAQESTAISFQKDIVPILTASCVGCHDPEKKKGGLDLSTHAGLMAGGKEGKVVAVGEPDKSSLVEQVSGPEPEMPAKGDPLKPEEIELIARWIREGAKDDTPAVAVHVGTSGEPGPPPAEQAPIYHVPPVITALAYSPDGAMLAVSGYYEVLLHRPDGSGLLGRLLSGSPRIESIAFSGDGRLLASGGGSPALFGHIQIWDSHSRQLVHNYKVSRDSLFGVTFSPEADRLAFGCADKSSRVIDVTTGRQIHRIDSHTDWCLAAAFTLDGKRLVTGGRDKAIKLIDMANGQYIDDINNPLDTVHCMARHPKQELVGYGGELGVPRIYRISDNQNRTSARNDTNLVRTFERQPGSVHAVAFSADGELFAVASVGEARIYRSKDGGRVATLAGHEGAIFAVAFHPEGKQIATGGYDGKVRIFDADDGKLVEEFIPVPIEEKDRI